MSLCPCGSRQDLENCCQPIVDGSEKAKTAESLMRARYTAHVLKNYDFLMESVHPAFREDLSAQKTEDEASQFAWEGLKISSTEKGEENDVDGFVSFSAYYNINQQLGEMREDATFRKEGDTWYYVESVTPDNEPFHRASEKIGRNDPCPCKSGKKYKKCCGAA